jgi:hypothetical protein
LAGIKGHSANVANVGFATACPTSGFRVFRPE